MTLNLMLASRSTVFLSGDFRITFLGTGRWRDDVRVQKLVPIFRFGWSALVAFTGIAASHQVGDVGDWISRELQDIDEDAGFQALPEKLLNANVWLSAESGYRRLAFSVVGFVGRRPYVMSISNFMDLDGRVFEPPLPALKQFDKRPKQVGVWVAGDRNAVTPEEVERLTRMLREGRPVPEIHAALAEVNRDAAGRSVMISPECVTGHLLASGSAAVSPHGIEDKVEYVPGFVQRELAAKGITGLKLKVGEDGKPLPPRWVAMTARIHGKRRRRQIVATLHVFRNVEELLKTGETPRNWTVFAKRAGESEPEFYSIDVTWHDE
jgi:hypothetical protein